MNWPLLFKILSVLIGLYQSARAALTIFAWKTLSPGRRIFVNGKAVASEVFWRVVRVVFCIVVYYCAS